MKNGRKQILKITTAQNSKICFASKKKRVITLDFLNGNAQLDTMREDHQKNLFAQNDCKIFMNLNSIR